MCLPELGYSMEKIIVIGGGGHAKVIIAILMKLNKYEVVGYTDISDNGLILGIPFLGKDDKLQTIFDSGIHNAVIGVGQIKSSVHKKRISEMLIDVGFKLPPIISPNCILNEDVKIGNGTVVMDGVVINSGARIGKFSIINTNASVDHDCFVGDFTHVAPGVTLSGEVKIGNNVLIGTGANVIQQVEIPDNTIISAGSSVQKSIKISGIYRGIPAKLIRRHTN